MSLGNKASEQIAARIEDIDETVARSWFIIKHARGLLCVRDKNLAIEVINA